MMMNKKIFGFSLVLLLSVIAVGGLWAQGLPSTHGGGFASPQNMATQGRLRSAADDFIRPDAYTGVKFENWFGMVSFASTSNATFGYARKINDLYLGVLYNGRFWADTNSFNYNKHTVESWRDQGSPVVREYDTLPTFTKTPLNQAAILVGIMDMGIRLTYTGTHQFFTDEEFLAEGKEIKSYKTDKGMISPQIAWSMTKNLLKDGIKPWVTFDMGIDRNYAKIHEYSRTETIVTSQNRILPELNAAVGGYTLLNINNWRTTADLEYRMRIFSWNNEYNYTDGNGNNKIGKFIGIYDDGKLTEQSRHDHRVRPIISSQWNGEKLRLRAKLDFNLIFDSQNKAPMDIKAGSTDGSLGIHGTSSETFIFQFNPDLRLAAHWQVVPKFSLNAGAQIAVNALERKTTTGDRYTYGARWEDTSYRKVETAYGDTINQLTLGATLNATDNLFFEAVVGTNAKLENNKFNVFDTENGPLNFGSLLLGLRY